MKMHYLFIITIIAFCTLTGCGSARQVSPPSTISSTLTSLNTKEYDSIYINHDHSVDYKFANPQIRDNSIPDTVMIRDVITEFRYKLFRDTIRIIRRDSIPYEVTVIETKEAPRPLTLYDKTCRACFWFLIGILSFSLIRFILKIHKL